MPAAPAGPAPESPYAWVVVAASVALIAIGNASYYTTVVALKPIALEFGWPRAIPALGYSLVMVGSGIGGVLVGRWSDRVGVAIPAALGVTMVAAGCAVVSRSQSAWSFLLAHAVLLGLLGNAALYGPLLANTTRWFERRRGMAVGIVSAGQTLAGTVWSPVFRLSNDAFGWRATYLYYGALVLVTLLPVTLLLRRPRPRPVRARPASGGAGAAARAPRLDFGLPEPAVLAVLCAAIVGCCVAMSMPLVHLVAHASDLGHGLAAGAAMLAVALGCGVVSRIGWGIVSDRIGGLRTLLATSSWQASALALLAFVDGEAALFATAAWFGLGYGGVVPSYALILREGLGLERIGQNVGLIVLFGTVGMALGGWLGARIFDATGSYGPAFLTGLAFNLANLSLVLFLIVRRRRARRPALA